MNNPVFGALPFIEQIQNNPVALGVLAVLGMMSILSWYLIISKSLKFLFLSWRSRRFQNRFWQAAQLEEMVHYLRQHKARDPFSRITQRGLNAALSHDYAATKGLINLCSHSEFITRNLRHGIDEEREYLNSGLTILASISSTAPFVGLLGTVMGIYHALINISQQGSASLDTVAGPVGEALIMTAIGLAVAIPAVMAYNTFIKLHRSYLHRLDTFANDLYAYLNAGIRVDQHNLHTLSTQSLAAVHRQANSFVEGN